MDEEQDYPRHRWITNPLEGLNVLPRKVNPIPKPEFDDQWVKENKIIKDAENIAKEGLGYSLSLYGQQLGNYGTVANQPRRMINITNDVEEIFRPNSSIYKQARKYYNNHPTAGWSEALRVSRLQAGVGPNDPKVYIPPNERIGTQKGDPLQSTIDPSQSRDWSKYERDEAAYFQNPRWPRDKEFNEIGNIIKSELKELYPDIPISHWRNHHTNPIKQGAWIVDGLKPEFREEAYKVLIKEGISAGHDPKQLNVIPKNIHTKIHRFVNNYLGKKYSVQKLEKTYFNGAKLSTIPYEERMPAIKQYANVIRESNEKIYDLMTALAVNKKHGPNVLPEVLAELNSKVDDVSDIGLDGIIKQIESEYGLQKIQGTVPKINVQQLAEQYSPNISIQERLIRDLTSGKYTRKQLKRKYPGFKVEQKDLFE